MKEIYRLHEKATALLELCKEEEERIEIVKSFEAINNLETHERALKRLKYSYMKVLMQIAEL